MAATSDFKVDGGDEVKAIQKDVYQDDAVEWKLLNKILLPQYRDYINRLSPALFTGIRVEVHRAMQLAFIEYGTITYEGLDRFLKGKVPGELTAATQGDLQTLLDQAMRVAKKRQLRDSSKRLSTLAQQYNPDDNEIRAAIDLEPIMPEEDSSLSLGVQGFLGNLHAKRSGEYIFAKTGFKTLDRHMGGEWKPKGLILLAGGAGSGKTAIWVNSQKAMAKGYVSKHGELIQTASLFLSLEMSKEDLILKMVADELCINNSDLLAGDFDRIVAESDFKNVDELIAAIEDKTAELQQLPMFIVDNGQLNLAQIVYVIRKHVHKYNVRVVAIDYMQLVNHHPTGNDNNDLGDLAQVLKELAKRENITIILLSQINRAGEGLDAIRDSGEVQAVVDVVIQLLPHEEDGISMNTALRGVDLGWWKNRFGPANRKTQLMLHGPYQRFMEG